MWYYTTGESLNLKIKQWQGNVWLPVFVQYAESCFGLFENTLTKCSLWADDVVMMLRSEEWLWRAFSDLPLSVDVNKITVDVTTCIWEKVKSIKRKIYYYYSGLFEHWLNFCEENGIKGIRFVQQRWRFSNLLMKTSVASENSMKSLLINQVFCEQWRSIKHKISTVEQLSIEVNLCSGFFPMWCSFLFLHFQRFSLETTCLTKKIKYGVLCQLSYLYWFHGQKNVPPTQNLRKIAK